MQTPTPPGRCTDRHREAPSRPRGHRALRPRDARPPWWRPGAAARHVGCIPTRPRPARRRRPGQPAHRRAEGKSRTNVPVRGLDAGHLGLLEHHLAHEHRPWVARASATEGDEGSGVRNSMTPRRNWASAVCAPGAVSSVGARHAQASSVAYGRPRAGALSRIHTMSLRRKKHTSSPRWLKPFDSTVTTPRSGLDDDGVLASTRVSA